MKERKQKDIVETIPNFSVEKARLAQLKLSRMIIHEDILPPQIQLIAGVDTAYMKDCSIGSVAVLDYSTLKVLESNFVICRTLFPYIPTLLSFRELPPAILSIQKLHLKPDVFLVDAHGSAHPYHCGLASHLGVVIDKPTIGVAKSWLFGKVEDTVSRNDVAFLRGDDEVVGAVVATKPGSKPVYVSTGHKVSLRTAITIVKHCTRQTRVPKPILKAHEISVAERKKLKHSNM